MVDGPTLGSDIAEINLSIKDSWCRSVHNGTPDAMSENNDQRLFERFNVSLAVEISTEEITVPGHIRQGDSNR